MYLTMLSIFTLLKVIIYYIINAVQQTAYSKELFTLFSSERYTDISLHSNYHYFVF